MPHLLFWLSAACIALAWAIWLSARLLRRRRERKAVFGDLGRKIARAHVGLPPA